jgi:hypothetical protein
MSRYGAASPLVVVPAAAVAADAVGVAPATLTAAGAADEAGTVLAGGVLGTGTLAATLDDADGLAG